MTWVTRQNSKRTIDRAGEILVAGDRHRADVEAALEVINNWRSCHAFPLNTMQIGLRRLARQVDTQPIIAQRIKRLSSIVLKLQRFPTMTLSQMQDLGGCRAIVSDLPRVLFLDTDAFLQVVQEALGASRIRSRRTRGQFAMS